MDIAVIGLACQFAHAPDEDAFWHNLLEARECFDEVPAERWHNDVFHSDHGRDVDRTYVRKGAFIDSVRDFAAMHFGIAPRRVQHMDPQHRLLYDCTRVALQDAGLERGLHDWLDGRRAQPARLDPTRTGTFLGVSSSEYRDLIATRTMAIEMAAGGFGRKPDEAAARQLLDTVENLAPISSFSMPGSLLNMSAANLAHHWGLRGPAYTIDAACASALVAVYDAVLYLRAGICDTAIAGGVYLNLNPNNLISFSRIGAISRQGRCRPFDADADGFLQGDGVGIVVLKRLEDARRDGDRVRAVIRGVGINNDGNQSSGPMAPSLDGQLEAIRYAQRDADIDLATIELVECHGTATPVGDPVEVAALQKAFGEHRPADGVWLTSVKANIGHTMSAAGIAGLIKAILALEHHTIPPQAAFETPHDKLDLTGMRIPTEAVAWAPTERHPRRAAVSSFGFGGTNCHVIIEEGDHASERADARHGAAADVTDTLAPIRTVADPGPSRTHLVVLTAPTRQLLAVHARRTADALRQRPDADLGDVAFTLTATRRWDAARLCLTVDSLDKLVADLGKAADKLESDAELDPRTARIGLTTFYGEARRGQATPEVVFMFPGQGAQRIGLLQDWYTRYPGFARRLDALAAAVDDRLERPLLEVLYPDTDTLRTEAGRADAEAALAQTEVCQPAMAALGLALAGWLGELGLRPDVTLGHSLGEFVAAAAGGMLDPADAVRFVAERGRIMADLDVADRGAMAAIMGDREAVAPILDGLDGVVLANLNHARQTVISGTSEGVAQAVERFKAADIPATPLRVSHAFHSPVVAPANAGIARLVEALRLAPPTRATVVSAITGQPYPDDVDAIRHTFVEHATAAVDFVAALDAALPASDEAPPRIFVEVGAGKTLTSFTKGRLPGASYAVRLAHTEPDGDQQLARALGQLVRSGLELDLSGLYDADCRVVSLPATPVATESYWIVQERTVPVKMPENLDLEPAPAPTTTIAATVASPAQPNAELVALFREQAAVMQQHARIVEQQLAVLQGAPAPSPAPSALRSAHGTSPWSGEEVGGLHGEHTLPPDQGAEAGGLGSQPTLPPDQGGMSAKRTGGADIAQLVLQAVATVSQFPLDTLDGDQSLARDLGFDSLMFVELASKLEEMVPGFSGGIPRTILSESTTIGQISDWLTEELGGGASSVTGDAGASSTASLEAADGPRTRGLDNLGRYAPTLVARPRSAMPGPQARLGELVLVTLDGAGVGQALVDTLLEGGSQVIALDTDGDSTQVRADASRPGLSRRTATFDAAGIDAVFDELGERGLVPDAVIHAAALDAAGSAAEAVVVAQRLAAGGQRGRSGEPPRGFVVLTGLGGGLGLDDAPTGEVAQQGLIGFARSLAREWPHSRVRIFDTAPNDSPAARAAEVAAELRGPHGEVEVGFRGGERRVVELAPLPRGLEPGEVSGLGADDVVLVTGGSRGLGAKCAVALAERARCAFILVGRSAVDASPETGQALAAIQKHGGRARYVRWDITEATAPTALAEAIGALGPVTAVVHAAGLLRDRRVAEKSPDDVRQVFGPKVSGLNHVLAALGTAPRLVVGFSSWASQYGNVGQTDYAAANAVLDAMLGDLGGRDGVRAVSILWPPWDDSAMVRTIPSMVRRAMEAEGVTFLSDADGQDALWREIVSGHGRVVIGADLPVVQQRMDADVRLSVDSHPYLDHHRLKDAPVLPLASALDYMGAAALDALDGRWPLVLEDMTLFAGVEVDQPVHLAIALERTTWENGRGSQARVELRVRDEAGGNERLAYRVTIGRPETTGGAAIEPVAESRAAARRGDALPLTLEAFYASKTFHGPQLQGITAIDEVGPSHVIGRVRSSTPGDWIVGARRSSWAVDPLVIDSSFQLVAYWLLVEHEVVCFPVGFERYVQHAPLSGEVRCVVVERERGSSSAPFVGSIRYEDADGRLLAELHGVQATVLRRGDEVSAEPAGGAPEPAAEPAAAIDPKHWDIEHFDEVKELRQRLEMAEMIGLRNPYFPVHEGIARDTCIIGGRELINFSSYNYLGFSGDPDIAAAAKAAVDRFGTSVSASRVASGERPLHGQLERRISELIGVEDAVLFSAGYMTNESALGHLFGEGDLIVHDGLAHNSVMLGARNSGARRVAFPHDDIVALDRLLTRLRPSHKKCVIVIEGVYSMDGDIPDLPAYLELKRRHKCLMFVDEAHSIGVLGPRGGGIADHFGIDANEVDFWMGTLSKSFSSCGGYLAGRKLMVEYMKYTVPGFVFSAGISPANTAAALASVEKMLAHPERVARLQQNAARFLALLGERGVDTGLSADSAVVPCIVGNSFKCLQLSERLSERGINVQPIVYPAVDDGAARLRFFISALHTDEQLIYTADVLSEELVALEIISSTQPGA